MVNSYTHGSFAPAISIEIQMRDANPSRCRLCLRRGDGEFGEALLPERRGSGDWKTHLKICQLGSLFPTEWKHFPNHQPISHLFFTLCCVLVLPIRLYKWIHTINDDKSEHEQHSFWVRSTHLCFHCGSGSCAEVMLPGPSRAWVDAIEKSAHQY